MKAAWLFFFPLLALGARGDYYRHSFFDNSNTPDRYYFSEGTAIAPAKLALVDGKLPVESAIFRTLPNALRLKWSSAPGGSWEAVIQLERWRNHPITFALEEREAEEKPCTHRAKRSKALARLPH